MLTRSGTSGGSTPLTCKGRLLRSKLPIHSPFRADSRSDPGLGLLGKTALKLGMVLVLPRLRSSCLFGRNLFSWGGLRSQALKHSSPGMITLSTNSELLLDVEKKKEKEKRTEPYSGSSRKARRQGKTGDLLPVLRPPLYRYRVSHFTSPTPLSTET